MIEIGNASGFPRGDWGRLNEICVRLFLYDINNGEEHYYMIFLIVLQFHSIESDLDLDLSGGQLQLRQP